MQADTMHVRSGRHRLAPNGHRPTEDARAYRARSSARPPVPAARPTSTHPCATCLSASLPAFASAPPHTAASGPMTDRPKRAILRCDCKAPPSLFGAAQTQLLRPAARPNTPAARPAGWGCVGVHEAMRQQPQIEAGTGCSNRGEHEGGTALAPRIRPADAVEVVGGLEDDMHEGPELESCEGVALREQVQVRPRAAAMHVTVSE